MMIFTPQATFSHDLVAQVRVLAGVPKESIGGPIRPRLAVDLRVNSDIRIYYGDEAADVLEQLTGAGVLTPPQRDRVLARLRDEGEIAEAGGIR